MRALDRYRGVRKLHALQKRYYETFDDSAIPEYIALLSELRKRYAALPRGKRALHLGSGGHHLNEWVNIDLDFNQVEVAADLGSGLPFRSGSIDFAHMEDVIEHLTLQQAATCLAEVARVLRRGGVLRVLTIDLRRLIDSVYFRKESRHLAWCAKHLGTTSPAEAFNALMRIDGEHVFIYDEDSLRSRLESLGFEVRSMAWNRSRCPELTFLDLRDFGISMFLEAVKN